jgi:hypothetical protein
MIANTVVNEIRCLLREGALSQRMIARRMGVSRGTVLAIARGKRPEYPQRRSAEEDFPMPAGLPKRCPGCGGLVRMPCLLCYVRNVAQPPSAGKNRRPRRERLAFRG